MPGLLGQAQAQFRSESFSDRQSLAAQGRKTAGSAAELQAQQPWAQFCKALAMAGQRSQHAGQLHAQGDGGGMLQPGAPHQGGIGMQQGLARQSLGQLGKIGLDQRQGIAQLQYQTGVHGVLAGRAQVNVTLGLRYAAGDHFAQGLHQGDRRVARRGDGLS